jgi:hypothetical protein
MYNLDVVGLIDGFAYITRNLRRHLLAGASEKLTTMVLSLPADIVLVILSHLSTLDLLNFRQVFFEELSF